MKALKALFGVAIIVVVVLVVVRLVPQARCTSYAGVCG